jgi:demethylmenaquinone methyltransferase/2-methoxy-6-polyprenyl-1,4-benzoquinol methylase
MRLPLNHFDLIARWYDRLLHRPADDCLPDLVAAQPGSLVLDIGGGTGRHAATIQAAGATVIVCDSSPGMARQALEKGLPVVLCDVTRLPFPSGVADRSLVVDAFHHFVMPTPQAAQPAAAAELARILAVRGQLVVEEPDVRLGEC